MTVLPLLNALRINLTVGTLLTMCIGPFPDVVVRPDASERSRDLVPFSHTPPGVVSTRFVDVYLVATLMYSPPHAFSTAGVGSSKAEADWLKRGHHL